MLRLLTGLLRQVRPPQSAWHLREAFGTATTRTADALLSLYSPDGELPRGSLLWPLTQGASGDPQWCPLAPLTPYSEQVAGT